MHSKVPLGAAISYIGICHTHVLRWCFHVLCRDCLFSECWGCAAGTLCSRNEVQHSTTPGCTAHAWEIRQLWTHQDLYQEYHVSPTVCVLCAQAWLCSQAETLQLHNNTPSIFCNHFRGISDSWCFIEISSCVVGTGRSLALRVSSLQHYWATWERRTWGKPSVTTSRRFSPC